MIDALPIVIFVVLAGLLFIAVFILYYFLSNQVENNKAAISYRREMSNRHHALIFEILQEVFPNYPYHNFPYPTTKTPPPDHCADSDWGETVSYPSTLEEKAAVYESGVEAGIPASAMKNIMSQEVLPGGPHLCSDWTKASEEVVHINDDDSHAGPLETMNREQS